MPVKPTLRKFARLVFDLLYQGTKVKTQMDSVTGLADWRDSLLPKEASAFQGQPHTFTLQPAAP